MVYFMENPTNSWMMAGSTSISGNLHFPVNSWKLYLFFNGFEDIMDIWMHIRSGWWYTYPSEKYEFVSWDDYSQYMEK